MEGPVVVVASAEEVEDRAGGSDGGGSGKFCERVRTEGEDEEESGDGGEDRERVKRHAEGSRDVGVLTAQREQAEVLKQELEQDANDDKQRDDLAEGEETEECGGETERDERAVGKVVARVQGCERAEEVAIASGGPGDAGVAEQQREDAGKGAPKDKRGEDAGGGGTEGGMGEIGDHGDAIGGVECAGAERGQQGKVHGEIESGDQGEREQNGSGDGALRVANFRAEEADVVVAPVVIAGDESSLGERGCESEGGPSDE